MFIEKNVHLQIETYEQIFVKKWINHPFTAQ